MIDSMEYAVYALHPHVMWRASDTQVTMLVCRALHYYG